MRPPRWSPKSFRRGIELREQERQAEIPPPSKRPKVRAKVAYLQGLVGARLYFDEVLRILVPLTQWWSQSKLQERILKIDQANLRRLLERSLTGQATIRRTLHHLKDTSRSQG